MTTTSKSLCRHVENYVRGQGHIMSRHLVKTFLSIKDLRPQVKLKTIVLKRILSKYFILLEGLLSLQEDQGQEAF